MPNERNTPQTSVANADLDDSDVEQVQSLLQSSDSEFEWSDDDLPRPKKMKWR